MRNFQTLKVKEIDIEEIQQILKEKYLLNIYVNLSARESYATLFK